MDLREALAAYSGWLGYGHGERAGAWLARLELNQPELEAFRDAPVSGDAPYAPTATEVRPPNGKRSLAANLPADAAEALQRAKAQAPLHAFTHVALQKGGGGMLAGVPVAVKDLMHVRGMPLTGGSNAMDA